MTDEELDALEALANAATDGPWTERLGPYGIPLVIGPDGVEVLHANHERTECDANASLARHARTAIPALIAEVRRLRRKANEEDIHSMPFTDDPFSDWIDAHRVEMAQHIGHHVVIDPAVGIIDAGDDPVALSRKHNRGREVMITYVADHFYRLAPSEG